MRVVYEGPSPGVWIADDNVFAARGEHTDVSDEQAERLTEQAAFTVVGQGVGYPYHVGGGWYETSDGERHHGEQTARAHERTLNSEEE